MARAWVTEGASFLLIPSHGSPFPGNLSEVVAETEVPAHVRWVGQIHASSSTSSSRKASLTKRPLNVFPLPETSWQLQKCSAPRKPAWYTGALPWWCLPPWYPLCHTGALPRWCPPLGDLLPHRSSAFPLSLELQIITNSFQEQPLWSVSFIFQVSRQEPKDHWLSEFSVTDPTHNLLS